jgi:hypothetical protein
MISYNIDMDMWNWQTAVSSNGYGIDWKSYVPDTVSVEAIEDNGFFVRTLSTKFAFRGESMTTKDGWRSTPMLHRSAATLDPRAFLGTGHRSGPRRTHHGRLPTRLPARGMSPMTPQEVCMSGGILTTCQRGLHERSTLLLWFRSAPSTATSPSPPHRKSLSLPAASLIAPRAAPRRGH